MNIYRMLPAGYAAGLLFMVLAMPQRMVAQAQQRVVTPNDTLVSPEVSPDHRVTFRIYAPKASEVAITGDWISQGRGTGGNLRKDDQGVWSITVGPLVPDFYSYTLTVDPELLVDFASRSIHETAITAKAMIKAYYNQAPHYSYFTGCSGGGGQALSEAQRFPGDYNGIVAGAPANFPTHMWPGELYAAWVTHRDPANMIPNEKLPLIANAVLAACDSLDGVKDGVIGDPRRCNFDPATIQCPGPDGPNCLTAAQVDSVKKIYAGLKDPATGKLFWYGYERSSELGWPGHINNPFNIPLNYFKYMAFQNPNWDWKTFDFTNPKNFALVSEASKKLGPVLDSTDPDLTPFKKLGGKLIQYHGWIDQNISPLNSISYYESVEKTMGGEKVTQDFYRLFLAPGMGHCGGGAGPNTLDGLSALEQWVEQGKAPDQIIATHATGGKVDRARPLCPYPQVAKYKGTGSTDDPANFVCTSESSKSAK